MAREISEIKKELETEAEINHVPIIRGDERELLLQAACIVQPERILEIGTAIGYSALLLAERFPFAVIDTIEIDGERHKKAVSVMEEAGISHRVHCHLGDAAEIIPALEGPYDFVYLDGPKGQYLRHLQLVEPMLSEAAVIAADNVLFRGLVRSSESIAHRYRTIVTRLREYMSYVDRNYDTRVYENGDGLAVSVRRKTDKEK